MSVLDRLKFYHPNFKSDFDASIDEPEQLQILLSEQPALALEYEALCIRLVALLNECKLHPDSLSLKTQLQHTLNESRQLNKHLLYLYAHSKSFAGAKKRLNQQRDKLDHAPSPDAHDKPMPPETPVNPTKPTILPGFLITFFAFLQKIRAKISEHNIIRLFFARLRRGLLNIKNMIEAFSTDATLSKSLLGPFEHLRYFFKTIFEPFDKYVFAPGMNFLSWLFLLPRLMVNIAFTNWRVVRHGGLSEKEKALTWQQRLQIEWRERWFEYANDFVWVPGGALIFFFLIGSLNTVGLILGVAMFGWDVVMSITRAIIELVRINQLINDHTDHLNTLTEPVEIENQTAFIKQLKAQQSYENKRHALSIVNNLVVTLLSFLAVSIIAFTPIVPIIASMLLLVVTITWIYLNKRINGLKPDSKLESLDMTSYDALLETMPSDKLQPEVLPSQEVLPSSNSFPQPTSRSATPHEESTSQLQLN